MVNLNLSRSRPMQLCVGALALVCLMTLAGWQADAWAQDDGAAGGSPSAAPPPAADGGAGATNAGDAGARPPAEAEGLNLFTLLFKGGIFMIPLLALSILVVTVTIERFIALRRSRILPPDLITALGQLGGPQGAFDPRKAYRLCQQFPSAAANVIRSMLLKVGRPHSEVEHAVAEASEREADRLYSMVKWLVLAAAVAPLIGLLGTVWGMIDAFHGFTQLEISANRSEVLASGIYTALVTTLAGLTVAIPAAIFAHYFESRITTLFHEIDEMLFNLLPQIERYEGRVRFGRQMGESEFPGPREKSVESEEVETRTAAVTPK